MDVRSDTEFRTLPESRPLCAGSWPHSHRLLIRVVGCAYKTDKANIQLPFVKVCQLIKVDCVKCEVVEFENVDLVKPSRKVLKQEPKAYSQNYVSQNPRCNERTYEEMKKSKAIMY